MSRWLVQTARGACMGIADIIPGVSGGTLALILGIYERFIDAVSAIGPGMVRAVFTKELWRRLVAGLKDPDATGDDKVGRYANQILFLAFLVLGIGAAIVVATRFIPSLLERYPAQMKGLFFGLVLASVVIPYRALKRRGPAQLVAFLLLAVGTFFLVGQPISQDGRATGVVSLELAKAPTEAVRVPARSVLVKTDLPKEDGRGLVSFGPRVDIELNPGQTRVDNLAVTARMTGEVANLDAGSLTRLETDGPLAGAKVIQSAPTSGGKNPATWFLFIAGFIAISAMVLPGISGSFILLMFGAYHFFTFNLKLFFASFDGGALVVLATTGAGILAGILIFSRFLKWLLAKHHDVTMAGLVGLMLGSLRKIWPFTSTGPDGVESNVLPDSFDTTAIVTLGLFAAGVVTVLVLERLGRARAPIGDNAA